MSALEIKFDTSRFDAALLLLGEYSKRGLEAEFGTGIKSIVNNAFYVTPPAHGKKAKEKVTEFDAGAQTRGIEKIDRELRGIFKPVPLKGVRRVRTCFGKEMWHPVLVPTKEFYPDVKGVYLERSARRGPRGGLKRGRKQPYYVDEKKFEALRQELHARVGTAASGFNAAARATGARIPSYARNKKAAGSVVLDISEKVLRFKFENSVGYISRVEQGDIANRIQYAVELTANGMFRRAPYLARAAGKEAGFKTS